MNNRNRFLVGSMALMIWSSGLIAPGFFVNTIYAEKPPSGGTTPAPTLVEIVGAAIPPTPTVVFTVPTGKRFVLKDIYVRCSDAGFEIHRDTSLVVQRSGQIETQIQYESGIAFETGNTVQLSQLSARINPCESPIPFYELRGFLEAQ